MFDAPLDGLYVWVGLSLVSVVLAGVAVGLPTDPPPNAASVADAVDAVAASPYASTAEHPTTAGSVRIGSHRLTLREGDATSHATLAYGPVTPAGDGRLARVLAGVPPEQVFDSPGALERAAERARKGTPTWRPTDGDVQIRKLTWGDLDVTLVGA